MVYAEIDQKTNKYQINDIDLFPVKDLLQINDFNYFIPKKYSTFYKYPVGKSGTAGGDFFTTIEFNELGLIKSIEKIFRTLIVNISIHTINLLNY